MPEVNVNVIPDHHLLLIDAPSRLFSVSTFQTHFLRAASSFTASEMRFLWLKDVLCLIRSIENHIFRVDSFFISWWRLDCQWFLWRLIINPDSLWFPWSDVLFSISSASFETITADISWHPNAATQEFTLIMWQRCKQPLCF